MLGVAASAAAALTGPAAAEDNPIAVIERRRGGRLGVFALDVGSGRTLSHRADERFLMCSTFKGLLAAHILARVEAGEERLNRRLAYAESDLIFTSPVTKAHVGEGSMSIEALCQAAVEASDNTAAILLMRASGGPAGLTRFVRSLGDTVTRSDRYEPDSNAYQGELDTTTPRAIATSARAILLGSVLSAGSRSKLEGWMVASLPGRNRLRAAFPGGWAAGDRPGTSLDRQTNDYAIVRPPGRAPLLVAAYFDAPGLAMAPREAALREVGGAIVTWAG